jgi:hypothetical protein
MNASSPSGGNPESHSIQWTGEFVAISILVIGLNSIFRSVIDSRHVICMRKAIEITSGGNISVDVDFFVDANLAVTVTI